MKLRTILLRVGIALLGLGLAYLSVLIVFIVWHPADMDERFRPRPRKPFSQSLWAATRFGDPDRYRMANDLLRSRRLLSLTEAEVRTLLGEPTGLDVVGGESLLGYDLVHQQQFPARCLFLPSFLFMNTDTWLLQVRCERGRVKAVTIRFT